MSNLSFRSAQRRPAGGSARPSGSAGQVPYPARSGLAGVEGFEPTILGFGDRCSNRTELHSSGPEMRTSDGGGGTQEACPAAPPGDAARLGGDIVGLDLAGEVE